jgi:hypothetical protein
MKFFLILKNISKKYEKNMKKMEKIWKINKN